LSNNKKVVLGVIFGAMLLCFFGVKLIEASELKLYLSEYKNQYDSAENIELAVLIQNGGKDEVLLPALFIPEDYYLRFEIKDNKGNKAPFIGKEFKLKLSEFDLFKMKPDALVGCKLNLKEYYKLGPGSYTLYAIFEITDRRRNEASTWVGRLESNEIKFVVQ